MRRQRYRSDGPIAASGTIGKTAVSADYFREREGKEDADKNPENDRFRFPRPTLAAEKSALGTPEILINILCHGDYFELLD